MKKRKSWSDVESVMLGLERFLLDWRCYGRVGDLLLVVLPPVSSGVIFLAPSLVFHSDPCLVNQTGPEVHRGTRGRYYL